MIGFLHDRHPKGASAGAWVGQEAALHARTGIGFHPVGRTSGTLHVGHVEAVEANAHERVGGENQRLHSATLADWSPVQNLTRVRFHWMIDNRRRLAPEAPAGDAA
jgi:hypothetical protein